MIRAGRLQVALAMAGEPYPRKSGRVMTALLCMKRLDIAALQRAYEGEAL